MRVPLVVLTGVDDVAMDSTMLSLSWGLSKAVAVRHTIDPVGQVLTRVVSDARGVLDRHETALEHACVDCALREDVLPTLDRLARDGRWEAIVSGLPVGTEADRVADVVERDPRLARLLRLSRVVAAVGAEDTLRDLLSSECLRDCGRHTGPDDERGLGEVASSQVEIADTVVLDDDPGAEALDLVRALARPGADIVVGADQLDPDALLGGRHAMSAARAWGMPTDYRPLPRLEAGLAWRTDLVSHRPFHPDRFLERLEELGGGPYRSRGCFWLPTRPGVVQQWAGAGGQLSIGSHSSWGRRPPLTRLVLTGIGNAPEHLVDVFEDLLVTPEEGLLNPRGWQVVEDGLEPWLGDVRDAA